MIKFAVPFLLIGGCTALLGDKYLAHQPATVNPQKAALRQKILTSAALPNTKMAQHNDLVVEAHEKGLLPDLTAEYEFLKKHHPEKPEYQSAYALCFYVGHDSQFNPQGVSYTGDEIGKAWQAAQSSVTGTGAKIPLCWINYGRFCYSFKNNPAEAERAYKKAVALAPSFAYAHVILGEFYSTPGAFCHPREALHQAQIALSLKPSYGPAYGVACYAYLAMHDGKNAYEVYKKGLSMTPGAEKNPAAIKFLAGLKSIADRQSLHNDSSQRKSIDG